MNTNLKAIGVVLQEMKTAMDARIDTQSDKNIESNSIMEAAFFKRLGENDAGLDEVITAIDEIRIFVNLNQGAIEGDIIEKFEAIKDEFYKAVADIPGTPGEKGEAGTAGADGQHGENGENGADGQDGADGEPGADGQHIGMDQAAKFIAGDDCKKNDLYTYKGGLWKCERQTFSAPNITDDRWTLIANGIDGTKTQSDAQAAQLSIELSDGTIQTLKINIPSPKHLNTVWEKGAEYEMRDVVWKDHNSFIALVDEPDGMPGESDQWAKYAMRGPGGRKGDKGDKGETGKRGMPGADGPTESTIKSFINHILVADDADTPIRRSRGAWALETDYSIGDVVNMGSGLYLCIDSHAGRAPASDYQAGDFWRVLVPAAGAGVGGGSSGGGGTVDLSGYQKTNQKGAASGYAPLDSSSKVPAANLPTPAPVDLSAYQATSEKGAASGYAPLDSSSIVPTANLPAPPDLSAFQTTAEKGQASGYAALDANSKVPAANLPVSTSAPHHIFATQADMLAGSAGVIAGEYVLVHGDPAADNNGEYIALQDAPTTLVHFDHIGEHVSSHRHDGADTDIDIDGAGTIATLQAYIDTKRIEKAAQDARIIALEGDQESETLVSLNTAQALAVKPNSFWMDDTQKLHWRDNAGTDFTIGMVPSS